jgi:hypothetical protein
MQRLLLLVALSFYEFFFTSRNEREIRDAMKDTTKASGQWSVASNSFLAFHSKKVG